MKKKAFVPVPRRDRNKEWCYAAGKAARDRNAPITAIKGLGLMGSFDSTRAQDLERAWRDGWIARDSEIRRENALW